MQKRVFISILLVSFLLSFCQKEVKISEQELEDAFTRAKSAYQELLSYNPPDPLTYHYRNFYTQAEQAKARGDYEKAYELAQKAEEQARLALQLWRGRIDEIGKKLAQAKEEIELLFPVNHNFIRRWWELKSKYEQRKYLEVEREVEKLLKDIEFEKKASLFPERTMIVTAPDEYLKRWGNVRIYEEITPEGKLRRIVERVPPGYKLKVIRINIYSPELIFYYVEDPMTGTRGWMLEKYLTFAEGGIK